MINKEEGMKHIHNVMHVFIEGLAAGVYTSLDDVQCDAREYLAMEKAIEKLGNWKPSDSIDDLAEIFDGISHSMAERKAKMEEDKEWQEVTNMPTLDLGDVNVK